MDYAFLIDSTAILKGARNTGELKEVFTNIIQSFGFQQFAYVRFNASDIIPEESIYTYSEAWKMIYLRKDYHHTDPVFARAFSEAEPFFWTADDYRDDPKLSAFFKEANQYGIYQGITTPLKSVAKKRAVLTCSSARTESGPSPPVENRNALIGTRIFAEVFHQMAIGFSHAYDHRLKPRERQVLKLSALGLPSEETATILGLNKDYVHEVIANALSRLGTRNRVAAVCRAQELGFLDDTE